jgi:hypothetical protein
MRFTRVTLPGLCLVALACAAWHSVTVGSGPNPEAAAQTPGKLLATDTAEGVVAKAIKACGGAEKINRWQVGKIKYKTSGSVLAGLPPGADCTVEETFQYPNQFKRAVSTMVNGKSLTVVYVMNGKQAWVKRGDSVEALTYSFSPKQRHDFARIIDFTGLTNIKITLVGEQRVENRPALVVRGEFEKNRKIDCYFDKATAFLVKTSEVAQDPRSGKQVMKEAVLADYKEIQGGQVPRRIKTYINGDLKLDIAILDIRFMEKIDEKEFARP